MKAWYCECKNTYTTDNCKCRDSYSAIPHGIGSLTGQGSSTGTNTSTSTTKSTESTDYQL